MAKRVALASGSVDGTSVAEDAVKHCRLIASRIDRDGDLTTKGGIHPRLVVCRCSVTTALDLTGTVGPADGLEENGGSVQACFLNHVLNGKVGGFPRLKSCDDGLGVFV
ncbi:hypothetical protein [Rhizobium sp. 21-4511-3d]|jgi:hypothetical protein